jgi:hypothetical protein
VGRSRSEVNGGLEFGYIDNRIENDLIALGVDVFRGKDSREAATRARRGIGDWR